MIQLQDENVALVPLTDEVQEHLEAIAVKLSERVEKVFSSAWFYNPVQIGCLERPLHSALGLDAFDRDLTSTNGLESEARLILAAAYLSAQSKHDDGIPNQPR